MDEVENLLKTQGHPRVGVHMTLSLQTNNMPEALTHSPMLLMAYSKDGQKLILEEKTLEWISQQEKKITVVSIVGPSGSGKSYLLNKFMGKEGFVNKNDLNGSTRGIWIWGMNHPSKQDEIILLMDTEGQNDIQRDDCNDVKTTLISMLLSSLLILNVTKKIGNASLEHLATVVGLIKRIHVNDEGMKDTQAFSKFLPGLLILIRDFQSSFCWKGKEVTSDEYLDICLQPKKNKSSFALDEFENSNSMVSEVFPKEKRHCRVLPSPKRDFSECPLEKGVPSFEAGIRDLMQEILKIAQPKALLRNGAFTGRLFASLIKKCVNTINEGETINILPNYALIAEDQNQRLIEEGVEKFRERMNKLKYPVDSKELLLTYHETSKEIAKELAPKATFDSANEFKDSLQNQFFQIYLEMIDINDATSERECKDFVMNLSRDITRNIGERKYYVDDGFKKYAEDIENLKRSYNFFAKGSKRDAVLLEFLSKQEFVRRAITQCILESIKEKAVKKQEEEIRELKEKLEEMKMENKSHLSTIVMLMDKMTVMSNNLNDD